MYVICGSLITGMSQKKSPLLLIDNILIFSSRIEKHTTETLQPTPSLAKKNKAKSRISATLKC
jgi:hypothetical protein